MVVVTKRRILAMLVLLTVLAGAGFGLLQNGGDAGDAPEPPAVTVTPPAADASDDGTPTGTADGSVGDATPTPAENGGSAGDGDDASAQSLSVTAAAADPDPVRHAFGSVGRLSGAVETDATWTGTADAAVVVYSVWVPDDGWAEAARRTVDVSGESALPESASTVELTYAKDGRASAFANPRDGTTRRTDGYVAVTVVLYDDGTEVARERATDAFAVEVTNVESSGGSSGTASADGTETDSGGDDGGDGDDGDESDAVELVVGDGSDASFRIDGVAPGDDGAVRTTVRNVGSDAGRFRVAVENVADEENGVLEPERDAGDDEATGELSGAVSVRISVGGDYLVGGEETWVPLSELASAESAAASLDAGATRTLLVEWRVDAGAGNEIQSDAAVVDVRLVLTQAV